MNIENRKKWFIFVILCALFGSMLVFGIYKGDADYVVKNAENFCFG